VKIETTRFGTIEIDPGQIVEFPEGLLGFEEYQRYVILEQPDRVFSFLQSVEAPWLSFVVMIPELLRSDYHVELEPQFVKELGFENPEEGKVLVIVTVPEDITEMTANLQAPIAINLKTKLGKQIVLMEGSYKIRHNVLAELQRNTYMATKAAAE
jgi:flagellar assembly factor FliW